MTGSPLGRVGVVVAVVAAALFVVAVRALVAGHQELDRAEALRRSPALDDLRDAVGHYRRAASWYVPGSPHVDRALDALARIAGAAEAAGRDDLALAAWRAVRSASATTRAPWPPHRARLEEADRAIARLSGVAPGPVVARDPNALAAALALVGLGAFVGGVAGGLLRGFDAQGRLVPRAAWRAGLVAGAGLVGLLVGLAWA